MRILYVSQYFPPEIGAPAARVYELSREWVRAGHAVTVLTAFAHHPTGIKAPRDRGVLTRREEIDGIEVLRTYIYAAPNRGIFRRMASYASFMASAVLIGGWRVRRPDVVIGTSPQLLCAVAARLISRAYASPFVFEVRDLWPESILAVEAMGENAVVRTLKGVAYSLYEGADRIVTVGEGYRRRIHELYGIPMEKMSVLPNGVDPNLFRPGPRDNDVRREYGWDDRFVVLYLGTLGMAHALDKVLEAARLLRDDRRIVFAFVGEGAEKDALRRRAGELELPNVQFIDAQPKDRVPSFYAACDLGLVSLRRAAIFEDVLPSKIFEYLAMERPIVLSVGGDAKALVEAARAGVYVPPEDPEALAQAVRRLAATPERRALMGRHGREYVLTHYDRTHLAERYLEILRGVTDQEAPVPAP